MDFIIAVHEGIEEDPPADNANDFGSEKASAMQWALLGSRQRGVTS